jgi:hypothetical protein
MTPILKVEAPIKTVSEMNARCHWSVRNKRRAEQRREVYYAWKVAVAGCKRRLSAPYLIKLTRRGIKVLDDDNCQGAMKFVRDQVAELLGLDDADDQITFEYAQETGSGYGVVIEVYQSESKPKKAAMNAEPKEN